MMKGWIQTTFKLENAEFSIVHNMNEVDVQNMFDNWIVHTISKTRDSFLAYIETFESYQIEAYADWNSVNDSDKTL